MIFKIFQWFGCIVFVVLTIGLAGCMMKWKEQHREMERKKGDEE